MFPWQVLIPPIVGAASYLLWKFFRNRRDQRIADERARAIQDSQAREERQAQRQQDRETEAEAEQKRTEKKIARIMQEGDQLLKDMLTKKAGLNSAELQKLSDAELVKELARKLPPELIDIFNIAAMQNDLNINLQSSEERVPANYPTSDIEPMVITEISQMAQVIPDQMLLDEDIFYHQLVHQQLLIMQAFEKLAQEKLLYVLLDVSGSMDEKMSNGLSRHVWARGIMLNLLMRALQGKSRYYFRPFDSVPHEIMKATNSQEAAELIDFILSTGFSSGGTNIFGAFKQAVFDIRRLGGELAQSEILIITDGDDPSMDDSEEVKKLLGADIRLHCLLIGNRSRSLQQVSQTYKEVA